MVLRNKIEQKPLTEEQLDYVVQEVKKILSEFLNEEIEGRIRMEVGKEVARRFREMGRI